jgi:hypothetical protein
MNDPITITVTRAAWLSQYHSPDELMQAVEGGAAGRVVDMVSIYGAPDKQEWAGYTRVGEAEVTLHLLPRDQQAALAVAALNRKLQELRAAYLAKQQEIMEQISKLQAITHEVSA